MKSRALPLPPPRRYHVAAAASSQCSVSYSQILPGFILNCLHEFFIVRIFDVLAKMKTFSVLEEFTDKPE